MDLLIGGQTTASAKFAVLNMTGSGTPTASISAGTGITGGAFLTAAGNLATTNKQSLTLGGVDTGNIVLNGFTGNNAVLYGTAGSGILASATIGVAGQCLHQVVHLLLLHGRRVGVRIRASKWSAVLTSIVPTDITDKVGIGTASDVPSSFYVTRDLASGALGKALAIFDQTESQDILTASAGGVTKFTILNNGIASSAGGFTINGAGSIQTTNAQTLTIGGSTTGNIVLNGFTGNNAVLYGTAGSGILASATIGVAGQCFTSSGTPFCSFMAGVSGVRIRSIQVERCSN